MKKIIISGLLLMFVWYAPLMSGEIEIHLLTCGPGTATYSIYGHSALRIVDKGTGNDIVYNWGVFDFSTPNFAWKFAKGRLNYMLGAYPYETFLKDYFFEERWVLSQKINLEDDDINRLLLLVSENMKPENIRYRYDFFYDNCSTRIRDLLEKSLGEKLKYLPDKTLETKSFRSLIREYQKWYQWLNMGIDLLISFPADKKASFRERMFLPIELQRRLSESFVFRDGEMIPLLQNPVMILDFKNPVKKKNLLMSPLTVLSFILIVIIILAGIFNESKMDHYIDVFIFLLFSILGFILIFFSFFSDHDQTKWNPNLIWLNPFIILCLISILFSRNWQIWFRLTFYLACLSLLMIIALPQNFNNGFFPLIVTLIYRSSARAGFSWNPFSRSHLT